MPKETLLNQLIEIKSYSGMESDISSFILGWFQDRGIPVEMQNGNVVAHIQGSSSNIACIMNSHMDTVVAGDGWETDPWTATKKGDKVFGLGASDMKAGLTASMLFAEKLARHGKPKADYWFTYVVMEEVDGTGSRDFAQWFEDEGYLDRYDDVAAIFTEPTRLSFIEYGHRGNIFLKVHADGTSGHASRPIQTNEHAVRKVIAFADALQGVLPEWREEFSKTNFEPPTVGEMTSIQAGIGLSEQDQTIGPESVNKFPSSCTATFDIRTVPGFHEVAFQRLEELAEQTGVILSHFADASPAGYTDPEDPLVQVAKKHMPGVELRLSQGAADLGFFTAKGIKSIIFGPGDESIIHKANEHVDPLEIPQAVHLYEAILKQWIDIHIK